MRGKRIAFFIISVLYALCAVAQDEFEVPHWDVDCSLGFNNDGPELSIGATWYPVKSFGVHMTLGMATEYDAMLDGVSEYYEDYWDPYSEDYAYRFKFSPSIIMKSPAVYKVVDDELGLYFYANPGIVLSPGSGGSYRAQWCVWDLRGGLELSNYDFVVRLGYGLSNFNLYSGFANVYDDELYRRGRKTHTVYATFGLRF